MFTKEEIKAALRRLKQEIERYERGLKNKTKLSRVHVRELYHAQRLCEEAARDLCLENRDLRDMIQEQRNRIGHLEQQVEELQGLVQEQKEENRRSNAHLQKQIDELKEQMTKNKRGEDHLRSALQSTLSAIENSSLKN